MATGKKIALIGGAGIRCPLLVDGLAREAEALGLAELVLYDIDSDRLSMMAALGQYICETQSSPLKVIACDDLRRAVSGASTILSSIRVGGTAARARDESIALRHGYAGQETTGPGGWAMALRTVPEVLNHARIIEAEAPDAWYVSFTNPAGLITQAVSSHSRLRAIGICDTPAELFHQIAHALRASPDDVVCDYIGLNHLGWVRRIAYKDQDVTSALLGNPSRLRSLYPAPLFDPELIQSLGLIPSEYLYFYYNQGKARDNQITAGATRGIEIERLNGTVVGRLQAMVAGNDLPGAVELYKHYLRQRSGSYMQLEGDAGSVTTSALQADDPFEAPTGYHRIALAVLRGLAGLSNAPIVVNARNNGVIPELADEDVIEVPCTISEAGVEPLRLRPLPEQVRGLVTALKQYERTTIQAAVERSGSLARLALFLCPIVGQWEPARALAKDLIESDPQYLGYLSSL